MLICKENEINVETIVNELKIYMMSEYNINKFLLNKEKKIEKTKIDNIFN